MTDFEHWLAKTEVDESKAAQFDALKELKKQLLGDLPDAYLPDLAEIEKEAQAKAAGMLADANPGFTVKQDPYVGGDKWYVLNADPPIEPPAVVSGEDPYTFEFDMDWKIKHDFGVASPLAQAKVTAVAGDIEPACTVEAAKPVELDGRCAAWADAARRSVDG